MTAVEKAIPEKNIVVLAPHYDDVVLTFGGYFNGLVKSGKLKDKKVRIVHVFSRSNYQAHDNRGNRNPSLRRVQFATGIRLMEDLECLDDLLGHGNYSYELKAERECVVRLASWKKGGEFEFPQGNPSTFDKEAKRIFATLKSYAAEWVAPADTAVLLPLCIKEPVDHVMLRDAILETKHALHGKAKAALYLGEDQPYTGLADDRDWRIANTWLAGHHAEAINYAIDADRKAALVKKHYPSQYEDHYREGILKRAHALAKEMLLPVGGVERMYRLSHI
ncbi:MAG: hypothetical protein V1913_06380 [Fibrobacterota bacterium]